LLGRPISLATLLFPAGAGVILRYVIEFFDHSSVPRRGGGDPLLSAHLRVDIHCSPQGRG